MKKLVVGILAHVDAGKTTLSEAMLYTCGMIREAGRVDNQDAFLDTFALEKERGITIFSKQAVIRQEHTMITLLDTPGHVDFSAEMERTLQVLDYAILVISGMDGVQGHTRTLWRLLERYKIPVFLFLNKMDQEGTDRAKLLAQCRENLSDTCIDFGTDSMEEIYENAALCEEDLLERFLQEGFLEREELQRLIVQRKLFPCYFGSALRMTGVKEFMNGLETYTTCPEYGTDFGARVFKIQRDRQGNRLTYLKVTGGTLKVRKLLSNEGYAASRPEEKQTGEKFSDREGQEEKIWREKVSQIRIYSGEKYEAVEEADAGTVCAVTGLTRTKPGQGLGAEQIPVLPVLEPVLTYQILLPPDIHAAAFLPSLRQLEEEEPQLRVAWDEELQEIQVQVMGEVQTEILQRLIEERFGVRISFGGGNIVYKETIADTVEGIGHFEPLRHYAEVHLLLEPGEPGSGMQYLADCSEDTLSRNWQRLILTHLEEKEHRGVLTGSALTDVKITLVSGRAHQKHTEGGDFRQAVYRAVRQGLMQAKSVLLEPYYRFRLEVPPENVGRAMTDLDQRGAEVSPPEAEGADAVLAGRAPVAALRDYPKEVAAYTKGMGRLSCVPDGYGVCHNAAEVVEARAYDPEADAANPPGSVFCSHGAGFYVSWESVPDYMHLESIWKARGKGQSSEWYDGQELSWKERRTQNKSEEILLGTEEIDDILDRTYHANRRKGYTAHKGISRRRQENRAQTRSYGADAVSHSAKKAPAKKEKYLLVDGYNVIFAWDDLSELAEENIDSARGKLQDILCNYQGMMKCNLIVVFDAYRVQNHPTEIFDYHNIHVVFTKEAETADQYIEKFAHENSRKYDVTVATSDGLEQIIIRGEGCHLMSARELQRDVEHVRQRVKTEHLEQQKNGGETLFDKLSEESKRQLGRAGEEK